MADLKNAQRVFNSDDSSAHRRVLLERGAGGRLRAKSSCRATRTSKLTSSRRTATRCPTTSGSRTSGRCTRPRARQTEGQTDIGAVAWMDEASRQALRAAHVNTVEQLATIGDDQVSRIGFGFVRFRDKARAEVDTRQKAAEYEPMQAELAAMKAQLAELMASPRRGRPPKEAPSRRDRADH